MLQSHFKTSSMRGVHLLFFAGVALLLCIGGTGCVRRRLTIRSDPPGAVVYADEQRIGRTPVSTYYTYYGTRSFKLFKDGYETVTVKQRFYPPWYQLPPLDFITENFWPHELRDERVIDFQLSKEQIIPNSKLRQQAEEMRRNVRSGFVAAVPDAAVTGSPVVHGPTLQTPVFRPTEDPRQLWSTPSSPGVLPRSGIKAETLW